MRKLAQNQPSTLQGLMDKVEEYIIQGHPEIDPWKEKGENSGRLTGKIKGE
jgi:hypothetical protein